MDRVDPDLNQEEQSYVRHYLGYADALIRSAEDNVLPESVRLSEEGPPQQPAEQPRVRLIEEPGTATDEDSVRAA